MDNLVSRRKFLQHAPVAAVIAATPASMAVAEVHAAPVEDGDTTCRRLARELIAAMTAHYGDGCQMIRNEDSGAVFFLPPPVPPRIVEFDGPGWYEIEGKGRDLPTEEMFVTIYEKYPVHPKDGRWFLAKPRDSKPRDTRIYQESWLRQIIVRKIGGAA